MTEFEMKKLKAENVRRIKDSKELRESIQRRNSIETFKNRSTITLKGCKK